MKKKNIIILLLSISIIMCIFAYKYKLNKSSNDSLTIAQTAKIETVKNIDKETRKKLETLAFEALDFSIRGLANISDKTHVKGLKTIISIFLLTLRKDEHHIKQIFWTMENSYF